MSIKLLKYIFTSFLAIAALSVISHAAIADDWSTLNKHKQTRLGLYLTAEQAYKKTMENMDKTLFVDIRTPSELNYLGAVSVMDAHVPLVFMDTTAWDDHKHRYKRTKNENFVADIDAALKKKGLTRSDTVILMCRSGKRSATAADMLAEKGYTSVYTVVDGYEGDKVKEGENKGKRMVNGWKNSNLPWTYSLDKDYMYFTK
ncbi:MAG: sulfurtransferase [Gammaproteobacteria bacterium]|nr:sulfurtransferase [Gammaproteobacteria bacterium]